MSPSCYICMLRRVSFKLLLHTVLDMMFATYHDKPLIFSWATFQERPVSHHRAMRNVVPRHLGTYFLISTKLQNCDKRQKYFWAYLKAISGERSFKYD